MRFRLPHLLKCRYPEWDHPSTEMATGSWIFSDGPRKIEVWQRWCTVCGMSNVKVVKVS